MKKILKLTESQMVSFIKKIVKEQEDDSIMDYIEEINFISKQFNPNITEMELEEMFDEMEEIMYQATIDENLSDDDIHEIHQYASDLAREIEEEFENLKSNEGF